MESVEGEGQQVCAQEASRRNDDPTSFRYCSTVRTTTVRMIRSRALRACTQEWPAVLLLPLGAVTTTTMMMTKGCASPYTLALQARRSVLTSGSASVSASTSVSVSARDGIDNGPRLAHTRAQPSR